MKFILENPYRVLGLPITASDREIAKRADDLAMYIEMGMTKKFDHDYLTSIKPVTRTLDSLERAKSQLELANHKIFHSIFWFSNASSVDQLAFELLKDEELDNAEQIWAKQILNEANYKNGSSYRNYAILNIIKLCNEPRDYIDRFLEFATQLFQGNCYSNDKALLQKIGGDNNRLGLVDIQSFMLDEFKKHIFNETKEVTTVKTQREFINVFSNADEVVKSQAVKSFTDAPIHRIESAIEDCQKQRKSDNSEADVAAEKLFTTACKYLTELENVIPKSNIHYQFIADKVAKELLVCSTQYFNYAIKHDETLDPHHVSENITLKALEVAVGDETIRKVKDDLNTISEMKEREEAEVLVEKIVTALPLLAPIDSMTAAQIQSIPTNLDQFLNQSLPTLRIMKTKSADAYSTWCEGIVNVVLNYVIVYGNEARNPNYSNALKILKRIDSLPKSYEIEQRFNQNYNVLRGNSQVQNSQSKSEGCYIATLVYGDYESPEVLVLREFRANVLANSTLGRLFIKFYYMVSPSLVRVLKNQHVIQSVIKRTLNSLVKRLSK